MDLLYFVVVHCPYICVFGALSLSVFSLSLSLSLSLYLSLYLSVCVSLSRSLSLSLSVCVCGGLSPPLCACACVVMTSLQVFLLSSAINMGSVLVSSRRRGFSAGLRLSSSRVAYIRLSHTHTHTHTHTQLLNQR